MDNKPKYKLPDSMKTQTLDLRTQSTQPVHQTRPLKDSQLPPPKKTPKQNSKASKWKFAAVILLIIVCIAGAIYIVFLLLAPKLLSTKSASGGISSAGPDNSNHIEIHSVGIKAPIVEGDVNALEKGAWHRLPQQGDPKKGGNFVITGHSFVWGYTPQQIKEKSIFFTLPDVKGNDTIKVTWDGKDYNYKVTDIKKVKPNQVEVETQTKDPQLTVYTCTLSGSSDGRVVVIAKPV